MTAEYAAIADVPDEVTHLRDSAGRDWWRDPLDLQTWFTPWPEDDGITAGELDQGRPFVRMTIDWRHQWPAPPQDGGPDAQG